MASKAIRRFWTGLVSAISMAAVVWGAMPSKVSAAVGDEVVSGDYAYTVVTNSTCEISEYGGDDVHVVVPSQIDGLTVVSIGDGAFAMSSIESCELPDTVKTIEKAAFALCVKLEEVTLPSGLISIGEGAFMYTALTSVVMPNSVTELGDVAFAYCPYLTSVKMSNGLFSTGRGAFAECPSLRTLILPSNVALISTVSFAYCDSLTSIEIPGTCVTIDEAAFGGCEGLTEVTISSGVTSIMQQAFAECPNLTRVVIPDSVQVIGENIFRDSPNARIYCNRYSYARQYAVANGIPYTLLDYTPAIPGATTNSANRSEAEAFVTRCYELVLERTPDSTGLNNWTNSLVNNQNTGAHVAYGFFFSQEFINKNVSNEEFVAILYRVFLNREPDQVGLNDWVGQLNSGASREQVFAGVCNSLEFFNLCVGYGITAGHYLQGIDCSRQQNVNAFVARLYSMCLGRIGDYNGQASWVRQLINGENSGAGVGYGFFFSPEFINRNLSNEEYVATLYRVFLGREPDQAGFTSWVLQLEDGASRINIFRGFAYSQEYTNICNSYGIVRGDI